MTNHSTRRLLATALTSAAAVIFSGVSFAQTLGDGYLTPRTEFGAPDLQGVWSIATQTNLERAERFGGKLVLTSDEAQRIEAAVQAGFEASNRPSDPNRDAPDSSNVGGYNTFWMDPGQRLAVVNGEIRTSIITDPADGRLPYSEKERQNFQAAMTQRASYDGPGSASAWRALRGRFWFYRWAHPSSPFCTTIRKSSKQRIMLCCLPR